jgi:hypothetical protein
MNTLSTLCVCILVLTSTTFLGAVFEVADIAALRIKMAADGDQSLVRG